MITNRNRAERAAGVLDYYEERTGDPDGALTDILTDLMHFCGSTHKSFSSALEMANHHYTEEVGEDE